LFAGVCETNPRCTSHVETIKGPISPIDYNATIAHEFPTISTEETTLMLINGNVSGKVIISYDFSLHALALKVKLNETLKLFDILLYTNVEEKAIILKRNRPKKASGLQVYKE